MSGRVALRLRRPLSGVRGSLAAGWSIGRTNHVVDGIDSRWEPKGGVVKRAEEAIAQSKPEPDSLELDAGFMRTNAFRDCDLRVTDASMESHRDGHGAPVAKAGWAEAWSGADNGMSP